MPCLKDSDKQMQRILILGSSGSGKSTLARRLGATLELPVIHLDRHFWNPGWVETPTSEWRSAVGKLVEREQWIIDGNYRDTLDIRLKAADTVIFLDLPRLTCMVGAITRRFKYINQPRPDIASGCEEKILDPNFPAFLWHIWNYPTRARSHVLRSLAKAEKSVDIVWLKSRQQANTFLLNPTDPTFRETTLPPFTANGTAVPQSLPNLTRSRHIDL